MTKDSSAETTAVRRSFPWSLIVGPIFLIAAAVAGASYQSHVSPRLTPENIYVMGDLNEISGLAYRASTGTIFTVGDEGTIAEIRLDGADIRRKRHRGRDFEDIVILPGDRRALVVDEHGGAVVEIDLDTLEIVGSRNVLHPSRGKAPKNRGYEGLTLDGADLVLACEDHPPSVVRVKPGSESPESVEVVDSPSISGVVATGEGDYLIVARTRGIAFWKPGVGRTTGWLGATHDNVEGAVLVPGKGLYLAVDGMPSKILFTSEVRSYEELRRLIKERGRD